MTSTIVELNAPSVAESTREVDSRRRRSHAIAARRSQPLFRPGWPITFTFAGFPLWWVLGISNFIGHIAAVLLLLELLRRRRIRAPRSFGLWLLFLAWVAAGVFVLSVDAPYAASVTSVGAYFTWAYRFGWYLSATVFMLYIGNMRAELSSERVTRALSMFFLTIVAGGWMAIVTPSLEFPSLLEVLLPHSIAQVDFVNFLIHPTVVQNYEASAAGFARPSAPFAYANFWGLNFACAAPFFILSWFRPGTGRPRRALGVLILLLAAVPVIFSWNRGLWLALLAMVAVLAIRSAIRGHVRTLVALIVATIVLVGGIMVSPLGEVIQSRLDNPTSNSTRSQLATLTTDSTLEGSPVVGFGSTRNSAASFYSIAGGDRPSCPNCSPPAMGTQGQFWLVLFAQGVLGIVFFYGFLLIWFARALRMRTLVSAAALCALLAHLATMTVYDSLGIGTIVMTSAIALLWREHDERKPPGPATGGIYTLGGYFRLLRHNVDWIAAWTASAAVLGVATQLALGNPVVASISVIVPAESASDQPGFTTSLDTLNQIAMSEGVRAEMRAATGVDAVRLEVSAISNSRILNLRYTGKDTGSALAGVTAAADALLESHGALLESERGSIVARLDAQYASLLRSVATLDASLAAIPQHDGMPHATLLQAARGRILADSASVANESARISSLTFEVGRVARLATARVTYDPLIIKGVSGLMVGLLICLLTARLRDMRRRRVGGVHDLSHALRLDILARLERTDLQRVLGRRDSVSSAEHRLGALSEVIQHAGAATVLPGDDRQLTRRLARWLDDELIARAAQRRDEPSGPADPTTGLRIVLVVSERARFGVVNWRIIRHQRAGRGIMGLIVIAESPRAIRAGMRRLHRHRSIREENGAARGTTSH